VVWVDDAAMRALNRQWRGRDRTTDVLSFPMREGRYADIAGEVLGDVVVSLENALRAARRRRASPDRRVAHLLVHGVLHLLGHDHLGSAQRRARMRAEEQRILRRVAGAAPALHLRPAASSRPSPRASVPPPRALRDR
jgi:probable rRNA maturation factor